VALSEDLAIEVIECLLREKESLETVFSDDPADHLSSEILMFWSLCEITHDDDGFSFGFAGADSFLVEAAMKNRGAFDLALTISTSHLINGFELSAPLRARFKTS
jgi:hypothetical protein